MFLKADMSGCKPNGFSNGSQLQAIQATTRSLGAFKITTCNTCSLWEIEPS